MTNLVFDGSNLIHRSYHMVDAEGLKGNVINELVNRTTKMTLQTIFKIIEEHEYCKATVLLDLTPISELVHSLKESDEERSVVDDVIHQSKLLLRKFLNASLVPCYHYHGLEADDVAYIIAKMHTNNSNDDSHLWLIGGDVDWSQCVSPKVSIYDPVRRRTIDLAKMIEDYGTHHRLAYIAYCSMTRNKDGVTGVNGLGDVSASLLMNHLIDPDQDYYQIPIECPEDVPARIYNILWDNREQFHKCWEAIDYEWVIRNGYLIDVINCISRSNSEATNDDSVRSEILNQMSYDRMGACITRIDAYITRNIKL